MSYHEKAADYARRLVNIELEVMAARETRNEAVKDIKTEMKSLHLTKQEQKAVMLAVKLELEPLEKAQARREIEAEAEAIFDTMHLKRNDKQVKLS